MDYEEQKKARFKYYTWRTAAIFAGTSVLYYIPTLLLIVNIITQNSLLNGLHDFYGIDIYAFVFFVPVTYAAYKLGIKMALVTAFACMIILFPYATTKAQPVAMLQPTALGIILGAIGAAVAMLQRSEEQQRQRINEFNSLYKVGSITDTYKSLTDYFPALVNVIEKTLPENQGVRLDFNGQTYTSSGWVSRKYKVVEALIINGEFSGNLEIQFKNSNKRQPALVKAIAERVTGAIHEIELQHALNQYYQELEKLVEKRTHELENAREKLLRSERLAAVGELASAVSHELRNPLNVIQNCVYLLGLTLENSEQEEVAITLQMINQQVKISNRIVTDLLDFTRVKPPVLSQVNMTNLLAETMSSITVPENVSIIYELNTNGHNIIVDADQVSRAFTNIVSNAIQAISGQGQIDISTEIEGEYIVVVFKDTGCGIAEENLVKIFEPLFTTKPKGVGLGLAITKRLVELNGGLITVKSKINEGTVFTIKLPLEQKEEKEHERATERIGSR